MSIFMTKRRKAKIAKKQQEELEIKQAKDMQAKMNIKRTLVGMKNQSRKLDQFKANYIKKAREAIKIGNPQTLKMAKSGLKMCLGKQKILDTMVINFEITMELNDMNKVINQFVDGVNTISSQMKEITTSTTDFTKAQLAFDNAMSKNATQYEALEMFLEQAVDSFETMDIDSISISDSDLDNLITSQVDIKNENINVEIDKKLKILQEKLEG